LLTGAIVGHVGDGNFHALLVCDPSNENEMTLAKKLANTISVLVTVTKTVTCFIS